MTNLGMDANKPIWNGLTPAEIYKDYMSGLEQFCVLPESRIDKFGNYIDDQIVVENEENDTSVRAAFMKYTTDRRDPHFDVEFEIRIGAIFLTGVLALDSVNADLVMDKVEEAFDKCCRLIGKEPNDNKNVCKLSFGPDSRLISLN